MSSNTPPVAPQGTGNYGDAKAQAKAAKAYAKAQRPWYKKKRWIALIVIVAIILVTQLSGGDESSADGDSTEAVSQEDSNKEEGSEEPKAKPVEVEASAILKEFEANEAAADAKYKGKSLLVSGVLEKVDTEVFDEDKYVVNVADGGDFVVFTVNCKGLESDEVVSLTKGQQIQIQGEFEDGGDLGVDLSPCKVLS